MSDSMIRAIEKSELSESDKGKVINLLRMLSKSSMEMTAGELTAARLAAGLSPSQAAKRMDMPISHLLMFEGGGWDRSKGGFQAAIFDAAYGLEPRVLDPLS